MRKSLFEALTLMVAADNDLSASPLDPLVELLVSLNVLPVIVSVSGYEKIWLRISKSRSPALVSPLAKLNVESVMEQLPIRFHTTAPCPRRHWCPSPCC